MDDYEMPNTNLIQLYKNLENKFDMLEKEIVDLNKILENLKIKKKEEIENNRNLLFKTLFNWKALTDIKNLINLMKEYKKKENNISELISKLNKIYENIKLDNIRKAFELLKNFWKENKMKKQQFKKNREL